MKIFSVLHVLLFIKITEEVAFYYCFISNSDHNEENKV